MHMIAGVLQYVAVASFAEAWIEKVLYVALLYGFLPSPPSRRRGLKTCYSESFQDKCKSPPSRRRGLKILMQDMLMKICCRLLRGGVD